MTRHEVLSMEENDTERVDEHEVSIRSQILQSVKASPNLTIRPADLSQQLGFSINDAAAELCGLLQTVGQGSSFYFEEIEICDDANGNKRTIKSMVFKFPSDFERKVLRAEKKDSFQAWSKILIKALKVVTAFGLVISIIIVSTAVLAALVAAFVTLSRGGGESRAVRNNVSQKLKSLIFTIRQLLFCFAMLGPSGNDQNDFFREAAYNTWLVMSFCCGNPGNIFFWSRAGRLHQRLRSRPSRATFRSTFANSDGSHSEGRSLLSRNYLQSENNASIPVRTNTNHRQQPQPKSLISSLVEFLFGPTTPSGTSSADKWRLRSAVIVDKASGDGGYLRPISLQELAPFVDSPPTSLDDTFQVIAEGLSIVSYFNGIPSSRIIEKDETKKHDDGNESKALFEFPELISESHRTWYGESQMGDQGDEKTKEGFQNFFYCNDDAVPASLAGTTTALRQAGPKSLVILPKYLCEQRKTFSSLSRNQFFCCLLLTSFNFFGVVWLSRALETGGTLQRNLGTIGDFLKLGLIPVLWFYARLFVAIPISRVVYVLIYNMLCKQRNARRKCLASALI